MRPGKISLIIAAALALSCGETDKAADDQLDDPAGTGGGTGTTGGSGGGSGTGSGSGAGGNSGTGAGTGTGSGTGTSTGTGTGSGTGSGSGSDTGAGTGDSGDDGDPNATYGVSELLATQKIAIERFTSRPPAVGATVERVKTWLEPGWIWARLTYKVKAADGSFKEEALFISCHAHGTTLGCHKKNAAGPLEPTDDAGGTGDSTGTGGDLPPIDG